MWEFVKRNNFMESSRISYMELTFLFITFILVWIWNNKDIFILSRNLPGPFAWPIIGNALEFWCKDEDIFEKLVNVISRYPSPMRFWAGPKLAVVFREPDHIEKILSVSKFASKDDVYDFIKVFNGDGLITGSGPKWKRDRKLMSPLFAKRFVIQYLPVVVRHTKRLVEILETEQLDRPDFNVEPYIHRCVTDFVNESLLGIHSNAQGREMEEFLHHVSRGYELVHRRITKVWLRWNLIFRFTHYYKELRMGVSVVHGFFRESIRKLQSDYKPLDKYDDNESIRPIFEYMLDIQKSIPNFATEEEMVHHMTTIYSASEDPTTVICAFALVMLGMHPKHQEITFREIFEVIGTDRCITENDLSKLEYMEMVIKEVLRLFPIAPFIMRKGSSDVTIDGHLIPKHLSVVVAIHNVHRDPKYWEKPDNFYPEHFLPEQTQKRHPYAYLPFSAGPRGCVGKPYANTSLKVLLASILQKFEVQTDGTLQDLALTTDISVRSKTKKYPIRVVRRKLPS